MKRSLLLIAGLMSLLSDPLCLGYTATYSTIQSSSARKWLDVSKMTDGKVIVSSMLGTQNKLISYEFNPSTGAYIGLDITWTFTVVVPAEGISYNGQEYGYDTFYVSRAVNVSGVGFGHIEPWHADWGPNPDSPIYNQYKAIVGVSLLNPGDANSFAIDQNDAIFTYTIGDANRVDILWMTGTERILTGISVLGDINGDTKTDFIVSGAEQNGAGSSNLYVVKSSLSGYSMQAIEGTAVSQTEWTGVTNMGDIDGDNLLEFVAVANWRTATSANPVVLVQTDIPLLAVPENCNEVWAIGQGMLGDVNHDCRVDFEDIAIVANDWTKCNVPGDASCTE